MTLNANDTGETSNSPVSYTMDLPDWITCNSIIGISDPIKDTTVAYNQAVGRALMLYALGNNISFSSVYEYYYLNANQNNHTHDNQKSHWITEIETSLKNLTYKVEKTYRTKYNETIVLLSISEEIQDEGIDINVVGSFMYHYEYFNKTNGYGEKLLLKLTSTDSIKSLDWCSTISESKCLKMTDSDGNINILKKIPTTYTDTGNIIEDMVSSKIEYGLWDSLFDTFFQTLSIFESNNIVIENTSRQISNEENGNYDDKIQNLSRLVMKTNISCYLSNLSLKNNNLYAKWEVVER